MTQLVKIEDPAAIAWLKRLIDNTYEDPNSRVMMNSHQHVKAWHDALENVTTLETLWKTEFDARFKKAYEAEINPKPVKRVAKKTTTASKRKKREDPDPYKCKDHPTYSGLKQVPRSDCVKCWSLYKQFHPLDYPLKRKAFERKHGAASKH